MGVRRVPLEGGGFVELPRHEVEWLHDGAILEYEQRDPCPHEDCALLTGQLLHRLDGGWCVVSCGGLHACVRIPQGTHDDNTRDIHMRVRNPT